MVTKLLYDPITKRKLRPRFKFNGGRGAIVCRKCGKIIKQNVSRYDFKRIVENIFCVDCATEMIMKIFKTKIDEQTKSE